jgi:hypothetical protein
VSNGHDPDGKFGVFSDSPAGLAQIKAVDASMPLTLRHLQPIGYFFIFLCRITAQPDITSGGLANNNCSPENLELMNYTLIDGIISGLDRTTHVSGGGDTGTTTTHISIFSLLGERVLLKTKQPAMIADGDYLRLVGVRGQGQFTAIACKNITTGWATTFKRQGCAMTALIGFGIVGILFTLIFPLFVFMPIFSGVILFWIMKSDARIQSAHIMLKQCGQASTPPPLPTNPFR